MSVAQLKGRAALHRSITPCITVFLEVEVRWVKASVRCGVQPSLPFPYLPIWLKILWLKQRYVKSVRIAHWMSGLSSKERKKRRNVVCGCCDSTLVSVKIIICFVCGYELK